MKQQRLLRLLGFLLFIYSVFIPGTLWAVSDEMAITLITPKYIDGIISLTFEPLDDESVRYRIYRSDTKISSETDIDRAKLIAEITADALPLIDTPPADGEYFYAVTTLEEYTELIPYLNTTVQPVDFSPLPELISGFEIKLPADHGQEEVEIVLRFDPVEENYSYRLYQSNKQWSDLGEETPRAQISAEDNSFLLTVKRSTPFYFVITTVNRLGTENRTIIPGRNANIAAYSIEKVKPPTEIKEKPPTAKALIEQNLKKYFYQGKYRESLQAFRSILKKRDPSFEERGRVYFYMGQCSFYLRDYRRAVKYFIMSKETDAYRTSAGVWIDRCLEHIR